jgi:hypothetical protein
MSLQFKAHFLEGLETSSIPKFKLLAKEMTLKTANFEILEFRNLQLNIEELTIILNIINSFKKRFSIKSISFNSKLGDKGAIFLANNLPNTVKNLGLVGCNVRDHGANSILTWIQNATSLQMICIENNAISNEVKQKYYSYFKKYPAK